jgi:hypothetical protein
VLAAHFAVLVAMVFKGHDGLHISSAQLDRRFRREHHRRR